MDPLTTSSPTKRPSTSSTRFRLPIPTITLKKQHIYAFFVLLLIVATIVFPSVLNPFNPQSLLRITFLSPFQSTNQDDQSLEAKQKETDKSNATFCDYSNGEWVWDANYPSGLYNEKCQFLDPGFQCHNNGRMNQTFRHWRWQPHGCDLPRFNATDFLERSRNGTIVFAGDSIGRNQWESLICMLTKGVSNEASIYELSGMPITRHKGFFRIRFQEYNVTVEYYRAPFLVRSSRPPPGSPDQVRGAVKIDQLHWYSEKWVGGSILVFNAGHWWNDNKTIGGGMYFQQGQAINMTMHYMEAFRRSMKTWLSWAEQKLDPQRSHIFFRSYSPVHYRNGTWSTGGTCRNYMIPETNKTKLHGEPQFNQYISDAIEEMKAAKWKVNFLNITYLSELRSDGHPSIHREPIAPNPAIEDCSHWCLPGVPDTWNQILYAQLVAENFRTT